MTSIAISDDRWKRLPWKKFQKNLFRLQKRIYKAQKVGNYKLVRILQKLVLKSKAAKLLAIRQITQLNTGKCTAGIDGVKNLHCHQRLTLATQLNINHWHHAKLKRVWIPKSNGEQRPLGIPTIKDRVYQCLVKYALEPACEAYFNANSYGFRPARSTHDIQKMLFTNLNSNAKGLSKRILELDIEKCFDRIDHQYLMSQISLPKAAKLGIYRAIKAGVLNERQVTEMGSPQGGVISPLLANIALHGLENVGYKLRHKVVNGQGWINALTGIRSADDCVFILERLDDADALRIAIDGFLKIRGLNVKEAKTKLVQSTEGFDFLGWKFIVRKDGRFLCTPSDKNYKTIKGKIKSSLKDTNYTLEQRIAKVSSIIRGWRKYHQYCDMSQHSLWHTSYWVWKFIRKQGRFNRWQTNGILKKVSPSVPWSAAKFVKVKGDKSPYDGDLLYWSKRNSALYDGAIAKTLAKQQFKCQHCNLSFLSDDLIELHHIDGNHHNWKSSNLEALHRYCHQHQIVHSLKRNKSGR